MAIDYAIRAGQTYRQFRYLRTVIVTAAVYRSFDQELAPHHLTFRHRAGVTPYTSTFVFCRVLCFIKQSQPPFHCNPIGLRGLPYRTTDHYVQLASARLVVSRYVMALLHYRRHNYPDVRNPAHRLPCFGSETSPSHKLPTMPPVLDPDNGPRLEPPQTHQGISTAGFHRGELASPPKPPTPSFPHISVQSPIQSYSKRFMVFSVFPMGDCIITNISTSAESPGGDRANVTLHDIRAGSGTT